MMNKEIIKENVIIADFMGYIHSSDTDMDNWEMSCLTYHSSWNALMPVVEKIGKIELGKQEHESTGEMMPYYVHIYTFRDNMTRIHCFPLFTGETQIESTWLAVVDFIKWHKEQPPIQKTETAWIAAVDTDSFNYFAKQIEQKHFNKATSEGCALFQNVAQCQKECDRLNSE